MKSTEPSFAQSQQIAALPVPNLPLLRKVLDHIDAHPEEWNQGAWAAQAQTGCGTAYCIAGTALVMTGHSLAPGPTSIYDDGDEHTDAFRAVLDGLPNEHVLYSDTGCYESTVARAARVELGLTVGEADLLFHERNGRDAVQRYAEDIAARAGERL